MGLPPATLWQHLYRYSNENVRVPCYICAHPKGCNTYVSAIRRQPFRAKNGVIIRGRAEAYQVPMCARCHSVWEIRNDPEPEEPKKEETPRLDLGLSL